MLTYHSPSRNVKLYLTVWLIIFNDQVKQISFDNLTKSQTSKFINEEYE